jgi:hypothetical protein
MDNQFKPEVLMKEAFYFPHDCNATQDPKMVILLMECGFMGIGAFWVIIEILHQQKDGSITKDEFKKYLSFYGKQGTWDENSLTICEQALFTSKLLIEKNGIIYSERVKENLKNRKALIIKRREASNIRWGSNANAMQMQSKCNAIKERKGKERKGKEKKEEEGELLKHSTRFIKPTPSEVVGYASSINFVLDGEKFCDYYEARGWAIGKSPIKNWKACVRTWKKRQDDSNPKEKLIL